MPRLTYRRDIDGLRALAIIPVLLYHVGINGFSGGYIGVDIFFVISGYLITSIIIDEVKTDRFSLADFWSRRARRILPAAIAILIATLVGGWLVLAPEDFIELGRSTRMQAFFAANYYFLDQAGYFDGESHLKPLLHTWSLAIEAQFYLVFPLIWISLYKVFPRQIAYLTLLLFLLSLIANLVQINIDTDATFYLLHTRAWELLAGSLVAHFLHIKRGSKLMYELISGIAVLVIISCIVGYKKTTLFPGLAAIAPVAATAAIIWSNSHHTTLVSKILAWKPAVGVGAISYSLYLWHWPVIVYAHYLSIEPFSYGDKALLIGISFVLAYLSWRWIENPFRQKTRHLSNREIFIVSITSILLVAAVGQRIRILDGVPWRLPEQVIKFAAGAVWSKEQNRCHEFELDEIAAGDLCHFGSPNKPYPDLYVWGDSHAAALMPAIEKISIEQQFSTTLAAKSSCPPFFTVSATIDTECNDYNRAMFTRILNSKTEHVLLAGRWSGYTSQGDEPLLIDENNRLAVQGDRQNRLFEKHLTNTIAELLKHGKQVWLFSEVPHQKLNAPHELSKYAIRGQAIPVLGVSYDNHLQHQAFVHAVFASLAGERVQILHPGEKLCHKQFCPANTSSYSLYRDKNHLSSKGAEALSGVFEPLVTALKNKPD
jgi:peptidoglycan/LPS O-acetylase OafA/YrhL